MTPGALFDWDGVVIDSSAQHERSWELLADELGKTLSPDHFVRGFGMKNQVIIPEILGWSDDPEEIEAWSLRKEFLYREIIRVEGIQPLPGVTEWLDVLRERGVPCAVASSTHRENVEVVFDTIGIRSHFAAVVTAEDVIHGKPNPEVFVTGAQRIGRRPEECVVFEDALVGIEAGLAAGARVVAVATTNTLEDLHSAHLALCTLRDMSWDTFIGLFA